MDLLKADQRRTSLGVIEGLALGGYTLLVAWITLHHEPWADEAQAWLIARDSSLKDIFLKRLHYEGTPALWHFLLWILVRLHLPYAAIGWTSTLIGIVAAWIILRYSPFPRIIRVALPFTYALVFQTAIIARSYSLVPLLVFLLCILLTGRRERPVTFALIAGLLANTALLSGAMSLGFVVVYLWRRTCRKSHPAPSLEQARPPQNYRGLVKGAALLFLLWGTAIYTAIPAPDVTYGLGPTLTSHPAVARMLSKLTGIPLPAEKPASSRLPAPQQISLAKPGKLNAVQSKLWDVTHNRARKTFLTRSITLFVLLASLLFFPISSFNLLAAAFYVALLLWLHRHRTLPAILPLISVAVTGFFLGFGAQHTSLLWASLIAALWITWDKVDLKTATSWLDRTFTVLLLLVLVEQICWTAAAARFDIKERFDGSFDAARFVTSEVKTQPIAGFNYHSVAVAPYFDRKLFFNETSAYWPWRVADDSDKSLPEVVAKKPPYILVGEGYFGKVNMANQLIPGMLPQGSADSEAISAYLLRHGYRETHRFCGEHPARFGYSERDCDVIFEPVQ